MPVGAKFSAPAHPASCTTGTGGKAAGAWCWPPHPHIQCRGLKLGRAIPIPTVRALVACYREKRYLIYYRNRYKLTHDRLEQLLISTLCNRISPKEPCRKWRNVRWYKRYKPSLRDPFLRGRWLPSYSKKSSIFVELRGLTPSLRKPVTALQLEPVQSIWPLHNTCTSVRHASTVSPIQISFSLSLVASQIVNFMLK